MRVLILAVAVVLLLAACGGDADGASTTAAGAETTEATAVPTSTEAPATTTTTSAGAEGAIPDPQAGVTLVPGAGEDITAGDVFLYWYRDTVGGNYVALYAGPGIAGSAGLALCPGNSIASPDFKHISNTPVEDGSCEGFPTESASVQVCSGDVWLYRTLIPGDAEGTLYGSLEWNATDGSIKGLSSQFQTAPDLPELAFGLASYDLWEGFTSDGSSMITCSAPMP